ncbi:MAG: sigma-70 family RNA polymerase sigma factor [Polaromonas sp.]
MAGVESAVQIHIDRGDDLNARDVNGLTPLMLSAARNRPAICKLLLEAGADDGLLDPSGKAALAIAVATGADQSIAVFESVGGVDDPSPVQPILGDVESSAAPVLEPLITLLVSASNEAETISTVHPVEEDHPAEPENTSDFDSFGWEPEEERPPPDADSSWAKAAGAIQATITEYEPIDTSTDWEDIEIYLPERSLPLTRTDDADARERLRLLLLRAVREGSVPRMEVEALSINDDRSANPEGEALLSMLVNDLGAEVDERFEYASTTENFEVFVKPEETPDEKEIVTDALAFIESLASHRTEPLRIYQKEFQRQRRISAQEEVALAQAMESGLDAALDALAAWPHGIGLTLAAGRLVMAEQRPLTWISVGPVEAQPDIEPALEGKNDAETVGPDQAEEEVEPDGDLQFDTRPPPSSHTSDFLDALDRLAHLPVSSVPQGEGWRAVRETLSSLRLNRRFLLELADVEDDSAPDSATQYAQAVQAHLRARERMAVSNLKLVFHLAKKYLYSGEPLDDLAQEGNIGLLKAVERFDWRRGFKFSTYATWWIRQQIGRYVADKSRTIRVPVHIYEKAQRLSRETQAFELETRRAPELEEIAARMAMPAHKVAALQRLSPEPLPIHELLIDELIAVEAQSDFISPDPMDIVSQSELHNAIDKLLATLDLKEEKILRLRYGIGCQDSLTLDEIGQRYEVTRERIRQIETQTIRKLKHLSRMHGSDPKEAKQATKTNPIQRPATPKTAPAGLRTPPPIQSSSLDRLLSQAAEFGIPIEDERLGPSGRLWVNLIETPDNHYLKLVCELLALGFEFLPGKGYWK